MRTQTPTLKTSRLILRPIALTDAPAVQAGISNWNVIRELTTQVPWPYPPNGAEHYVREIVLPLVEKGHKHCWVIVLKEEGDEAIGVIEYRCEPGESDHRGFWLAEPYWGRGLMTEAVEAMQDWVFFELQVPYLYVLNAKANKRSHRIKEKTGAILIGEVSVEHHHGDSRTEKWLLTRDGWAVTRGRGLPQGEGR